MLAVVRSSTIVGVDGYPVHVEVHVANGLPAFSIVGLPDASCRESRDRVRAAVMTAGFKWPDRRITVNLAPTNLRKAGSTLDLAVALGVLAASDQIKPELLAGYGFLGELGLDGSIRPVVGALSLVHALGDLQPVVPSGNYNEAALIRPDALVAGSLQEAVSALQAKAPWGEPSQKSPAGAGVNDVLDLSDVHGQPLAKRALEVAAAGGHHILLTGPPGSGKTMLAERLPTILPELDEETAFDVSRIHSAAGQFQELDLIRRPPFRSPHHSSSLVSLLGGGTGSLRPGEVSLASGGVLFLDELGEFPASHLDALRQPLESGSIHIARAVASAILPARFLLVAATNPCPCGLGRWGECRCSAASLARYGRRLSSPLLDRFDIRIAVDPPDHRRVLPDGPVDSASQRVRVRVQAARELAQARGVRANRELRGSAIEDAAVLSTDAREHIRRLVGEGTLTMRGAQRLRVMALTIRDLEGIDGPIEKLDLAEAMMLRGVEQQIGVAS